MGNEGGEAIRLAVFDLDGTLVRGWSAETRLFCYLVRRRIIGAHQMLHYGLFALRRLSRGWVQSFHCNKFYLRDVRVDELERTLPEFCEGEIKANFAPRVVERMSDLKDRGYRAVIVSGSLQPIVAEVRKMLGLGDAIGSQLEVNDGAFTGHLMCERPYGVGKVAAIKRYFSGKRIDYAESYAFADRPSDVPLLKRFGHPVVVNAGGRLRRLARANGWEILD